MSPNAAFLFLTLASAPVAAADDAARSTDAPNGAPAERPAEASNVTEEITVIGDPRRGDLLLPGSNLEGADLRRRAASTLGETLEREPGVYNATFGPGVGQPVIRGMSGPRVQIMQGGIASFDASSVSPDHAVSIEALLADEIEVRRGPGSLRYGGSAMGGAVNVKSGRIPERRPDGGIDGALETRYDTNPDYHAGVFKVDAGLGPLVMHVDGFHRGGDGLNIPGNALDEDAVLEQFGNLVEFENTDGFVPNTDTRGSGFSVGGSLVFDRGFVGAAVNRMENLYGIPPGGLPPHSDDPGVVDPTPENLRIDMAHTRWDLAARLESPLPFVEGLSARAGHVDYEHTELARGLPSTRFDSVGTEARVELDHRFNEGWSGTLGYQWSRQNFGALGVESYIPTADILKNASYLIERFSLEPVTFEVSLRRESQTIAPEDEALMFNGRSIPLPENLDHNAQSAAAAVSLTLTPRLAMRFGMTRAERTPAIQEALSAGPHFATRSFTQGHYFAPGNDELEVESATNLDVALLYRSAPFDVDLSFYRNQVDDYLYQENMGFFYNIDSGFPQLVCVRLSDCLPVYLYRQQDAVFLGYEAQARVRLPEAFGVRSDLAVFSDYVRGYFKTEGAGSVPRLPPLRIGVTARAVWRAFDLEGRWVRGFEQDRPGLDETRTPGYDRVDIEAAFTGDVGFGDQTLLFIKAKNVLDAEIRHATSFLRNFTPEPGRSVEAGLRWTF